VKRAWILVQRTPCVNPFHRPSPHARGKDVEQASEKQAAHKFRAQSPHEQKQTANKKFERSSKFFVHPEI
jgi:hypothetical protein